MEGVSLFVSEWGPGLLVLLVIEGGKENREEQPEVGINSWQISVNKH